MFDRVLDTSVAHRTKTESVLCNFKEISIIFLVVMLHKISGLFILRLIQAVCPMSKLACLKTNLQKHFSFQTILLLRSTSELNSFQESFITSMDDLNLFF